MSWGALAERTLFNPSNLILDNTSVERAKIERFFGTFIKVLFYFVWLIFYKGRKV